MSWLSAALKRNGLDVVNKIAKPIQGAARTAVSNVVPGGSAILGIGDAIGKYVPQVGGGGAGGGSSPTATGQAAWDEMVKGLAPAVAGGASATPTDAKGWLEQIMSGITGKDALSAGASAANAALRYKSDAEKIAQQKAEFERTQGLTEKKDRDANAATAVSTQNLLNRAPMADNAQYLLRARMGAAPTTFAPRDFTKGPISAQTMAAPATGGPQDAMAAGRTAAASYTPGAGGVDTSVLEMLKKRMLSQSGMAG